MVLTAVVRIAIWKTPPNDFTKQSFKTDVDMLIADDNRTCLFQADEKQQNTPH